MVKQKTFPQESSEGQSSLVRRKFTVESAALSTATRDSSNGEERGGHAESHRSVGTSQGRVSTSEMRSQ